MMDRRRGSTRSGERTDQDGKNDEEHENLQSIGEPWAPFGTSHESRRGQGAAPRATARGTRHCRDTQNDQRVSPAGQILHLFTDTNTRHGTVTVYRSARWQ